MFLVSHLHRIDFLPLCLIFGKTLDYNHSTTRSFVMYKLRKENLIKLKCKISLNRFEIKKLKKAELDSFELIKKQKNSLKFEVARFRFKESFTFIYCRYVEQLFFCLKIA